MNQQSILQSNLLDIIFENRNKEYGAYVLRKTYRGRLAAAVFLMVIFVAGVSLVLLFQRPTGALALIKKGIEVPGTKISDYHPVTSSAGKQAIPKHSAAKIVGRVDRPPVIVYSTDINNLPATPGEIESSLTESVVGENSGGGGYGKDTAAMAPLTKTVPEPAEPNAVKTAEIMPEYPGGLQALLSFLKKNIHSPAGVDDGEEITVKVEFVVNYNGNLENFSVVKSGGEIFDNEVLRVLKKMPRWIPGQTKGKNVSVYYMVPVKFTSEF